MATDSLFKKRMRAFELSRVIESMLGRNNISWYAFGYATLLLLAIGWIPDGVSDFFDCKWQQWSWFQCLGCIYKIIFSLLIIIFFRWRILKSIKYQVKIAVNQSSPHAVSVLGLFLSPVAKTTSEQEKEMAIIASAISNKSLSSGFFVGKRWEMPLKAIDYHKSRLSKVLLFTSSGAHGTSIMHGLFKNIVQYLYPGTIVEEVKSGGIDFENVEDVFNAVEDFYLSNDNVMKSDILIDITGGQKTNSVAAAIATLATGRNFQYISTETKDVRVFDVCYMD